MGRYYANKKEESDSLRRITIFKLKEWGYFDGRFSGSITWTNSWSETKSSVDIQVHTFDESDQYLRILYTRTDLMTQEKKHYDYKVPLTQSQCNLGGKRYWFICPWYRNGTYCGRRVAVLYQGGEYFACRHCYNLSYASKNENRRYHLFPFRIIIELESKMDELRQKITTKYYRGKPTRKYAKLMELEQRYYGFDPRKVRNDLARVLRS